MKNIINHIIAVVLVGMCFLSPSCTGKFEEYNTNPIGVSDKELEQDFNHIGAYFPAIQQMIYCNYNWGWGTDWTFQVMQNLNADIYSGYLASSAIFGGSVVDNRTYKLNAGWNDSSWDYTYAYMMTNSLTVTQKCQDNIDEYYHFDAVNKILRVLAMSRICDLYGPIIYSDYGKDKTGSSYDSAQDAYKYFFKDLADAVTALDKYTTENPGLTPFVNFDMVYGGDYIRWIQFANTLRLRLAMRVVKYDATMAKTEAEAAMLAPHGIITRNSGNFTVSGRGYMHPLSAITNDWGNQTSINANVESILAGYNDPRIDRYGVVPDSASTVVRGMRTGIPNLMDFSRKYSRVTSKININRNVPAMLMTAAEAYFLCAEGVLRGWNTGTDIKTLYETGIRASFEQWGAPVGEYLNSTNMPADFVDQIQSSLVSSPAVSQVTPMWDDAASNEKKLEKIITQKWIAGFPEGMNAWAEYRRTGYPMLFPVLENDSQGTISTELGIRRLPFSSAEKSGNAAGYADAVQKLGGPDNGATRLFWDIDKPNL